jgi:hypothetical protein
VKDFLVSVLVNLGIPLLMLGVFFVFIEFIIRKQRARKRYAPFTEDMLRMPAQQLEKEAEDLDEPLFMGGMLIFLPAIVTLAAAKTNIVAWIAVGMVAVYGARKVWKAIHRAIPLRLAIDGERYTGQELSLLMRHGAWVYHDIPFAYGNIDHIVISTGGLFTVETKARRKPAGERESSRQSKVVFDGKNLTFPDWETDEPLQQARLQAKHLRAVVKKNLGLDVPVTPVVALPGWFVERTGKSDVWVLNPKRGGALATQVGKDILATADAERVANYIETVARSVPAGSKKMDPDASKHYDFWNQRRYKDRQL